MAIALGIFVLAVIAANVVATVMLVRASDLEPQQKVAQVAFVWLVPVVGALVVILLRREFTQPSKYRAPPPEGTDENAIDLAISVRGARRQEEEADAD